MSLFEDASLIVTPNGRKAGKIYALKPFNGSGDLTVVRATTATYVGSDGLIKTALANVPRLDYTNGSCPSILVEPQRTNLALRSEEFENANWVPASATITSNSAISPSGTLTADTFAGNGTNNLHLIGCSNFTPVGVTTISVFAKKNTNNFIQIIGSSTTFGANVWANFDLNNGVLGSVGSLTTAKIENYGNGWFRCSITGTSSIPATVSFNISLITSATSVRAESNTLSTSVYLWGAQLEQGSNATSYIPTTTTSVTRNADVISKTGIADLIGQTEGTIFVEINIDKDLLNRPFTNIITLQGAITNFLNICTDSSTSSIRVRVRKDSGSIVDIMLKNISIGTLKIAVKYINGNYKLFLNGILESTSTDSTNFPTPPLNTLVISSADFSSNIYPTKNIMLFKTQLTDQECIELTTL